MVVDTQNLIADDNAATVARPEVRLAVEGGIMAEDMILIDVDTALAMMADLENPLCDEHQEEDCFFCSGYDAAADEA